MKRRVETFECSSKSATACAGNLGFIPCNGVLKVFCEEHMKLYLQKGIE